jgi:hypothetical protein
MPSGPKFHDCPLPDWELFDDGMRYALDRGWISIVGNGVVSLSDAGKAEAERTG